VLRVTVGGSELPTVVLGSGETLLIGRAPQVPDTAPDAQLRFSAYPLPNCTPHVSRLLGEVIVGDETVRLRWHGGIEAQLSSMLDAPAGARRVILTEAMTVQLDDGENQLLVLRGKQIGASHADRQLVVDVTRSDTEVTRPIPLGLVDRDAAPTKDAPGLVQYGREWFVALALAEPWLTGADDYPRPPTNREIYERVLAWHGYAWNLERAQRVDDAIRRVAAVAFGPHDDPFRVAPGRQVRNIRFAVGRRAAEVRLVTVEDLASANRAATRRLRGLS
jgi:hypothetical protein